MFPERVYDVGIAEQHAVTFAAGLACEGLAPFVAIYSSFLQRGYDQVVHDVSLQNLPGAHGVAGCGCCVTACCARLMLHRLLLQAVQPVPCNDCYLRVHLLLLGCSAFCNGSRRPCGRGWRHALRCV